MASNDQPSKIPLRKKRVTKPSSPAPAPITPAATSASPSSIPRPLNRAAKVSPPSNRTPKATTPAQSSKLPRRAELITPKLTSKVIKEVPPSDILRSPEAAGHSTVEAQSPIVTPGPTTSNLNLNMNTVAGSVQTQNNNSSNIITNIYGPVPNESNTTQVKICTDLKPRYVPQALYDAQLGSGCMEGTRVKILNDIIDWVKDQSAQKIFWLTGWAGTGKSAIAWTICSRAANDPEIFLGGSFFFSRSASSAAQRDVRCLIPTLAQILARQSDLFSQALADELTRDPDVLHKHISVQIEKLLAKPLLALANFTVPIVLIIDALDECGDQPSRGGDLDDASTHRIVSEMLEVLIALFGTNSNLPVKFLVTSRPETHIRDTPVSDHEFSKVLRLQTVDKKQVTADIRLYIATKLLSTRKLRTRFTEKDADTLAQHCDGLFIVATTALKYTFERGHDAAAATFKTLLNASQNGLSTDSMAPLDRMYTLILEDAARGDKPTGEGLAAMLQLLAVLMSTRMVLSVVALADLLDRPTEDTRATLSRLHAVVHVPEDDGEPGLRTLHASFGDYVSRRAPGHIRLSDSDSHEVPARATIRVMAERLHFNISQSRTSYEPNSPTAHSGIPLSLQYACTQWVYHISSLADPSALDGMLQDLFCERFLFWLEVMSVLGQIQRAAAMLRFIGVTVRMPELSQFFRDANSFVASSREAIEQSAPHIYLSALPFANRNGTVYKTFVPLCIGLACVDVFGLAPHGGRLVMTLKGHEDGVTSVAYSGDGHFLVSGSKDGTVRVWDTRSGEETIAPLRSGSKHVTCVDFIQDGLSVAAGTDSGTVCIWGLLTGQSTMQQLVGHSKAVVSVASSSNSVFIASASEDQTVRVWRIGTGQLFTVLGGHDDPTKKIAVSQNGEVMISGSNYFQGIKHVIIYRDKKPPFCVSKTGQSMVAIEDKSICLWRQRNHDEPSLVRIEGHMAAVSSVVISPNSSYAASGSDDCSIRIWDIGGGNELDQPESAVYPPGLGPKCQAMSHKGATVVSLRYDNSIRVWNAETGETRLSPQAEHPRNVTSLAISSDGCLIVTGSQDGTIQLWNTQTGETVGEPLHGDKSPVASLTLSPDARWLASVTSDYDLSDIKLGAVSCILPYSHGMRIWDVRRCREMHNNPLPSNVGNYTMMTKWIEQLIAQQVYHLDISSDGQLVVAPAHFMSEDDVLLWQIDSNLEALKPRQIEAKVQFIGSLPDGTQIALSYRREEKEKGSYAWNISTGQTVFEFAGHTDPLTGVAYSPNGQLIATASEKSVQLWDVKTGVSVATLPEHDASVQLLGFANDRTLVSSSTDGTMSVWDVNAALSLPPENTDEAFLALFTATLKDGWLKGPSGELLLWVPAEYRSHLRMSPCIHRIADKLVSVKTSSEGWHRGQNWTSCWRGGELNTVSDTV